jgi:phenylpyruvate tautomerase PptA (4-oxalocrotonate tautomerase family)
MALAHVSVFRPLATDEADGILRAVRQSLVDALQVPDDDPTVWLTEHPADRVSPGTRPGIEATLVQVTLFAGRSPETKRRLHAKLAERLAAAGVPPATVLVFLVESPPENWSIAGMSQDQVDVGFRIDV